MRKKLSALCLVLTLFLLCSAGVSAAVDPDAPDYVVDDAGVLSSSTETLIRNTNAALEQSCYGAQIVVITTKYAPQGMDQQEFASEIFNTWNVGDARENNGFVLVLYTEGNEFWLECGEGILDACYDELADTFAEDNSDFIRALDKGKYDRAVEEALEEIREVLEEYYRRNGGGYSAPVYAPAPAASDNGRAGLGGIILLVILYLLLNRRSRRKRGVGLIPFLLGLSLGKRKNSGPTSGSFRTGYRSTGHSSFRSSSFGGFGGSSHSGFGGSSHGGFRGGGGHSGGGFGKR